MKLVRRIAAVLLAAAAVLVLAGGLALFAGLLPAHLYVVDSASMEPGIPVGSVVVVDTRADIEPGDVVSYTTGEAVVTHRVLSIEEDGTLVTKGDAMHQVDPFTVTLDDVIGEVTRVVPPGPVLSFLLTPVGAATLVLIIVAGATLTAALIPDRRKSINDTADRGAAETEGAEEAVPTPA